MRKGSCREGEKRKKETRERGKRRINNQGLSLEVDGVEGLLMVWMTLFEGSVEGGPEAEVNLVSVKA